MRQYLRDSQASAFPARQRQYISVSEFAQPDRVECRLGNGDVLRGFPLKSGNMGVPANHGRVEHRGRKYIVDVLREQRQRPGRFPATCRDDIVTMKERLSCGRRAQACERMQGQGFACAVLSEDGEEFSGAQLERQVLDQRSTGHVDAEVTTGKQRVPGGVHAHSVSQGESQ